MRSYLSISCASVILIAETMNIEKQLNFQCFVLVCDWSCWIFGSKHVALSRTEFLLNKQLLWFANGLVCAHRTNIHYSCMYTSEMLGCGCALLLCVGESFLGWHKNRCSNKNMARLTLSKCIPDLISATKSNDKRWFRFAFAVLIHTCAFPFVCQNSSPFDIVAYQKYPYHFTSAVETVQFSKIRLNISFSFSSARFGFCGAGHTPYWYSCVNQLWFSDVLCFRFPLHAGKVNDNEKQRAREYKTTEKSRRELRIKANKFRRITLTFYWFLFAMFLFLTLPPIRFTLDTTYTHRWQFVYVGMQFYATHIHGQFTRDPKYDECDDEEWKVTIQSICAIGCPLFCNQTAQWFVGTRAAQTKCDFDSGDMRLLYILSIALHICHPHTHIRYIPTLSVFARALWL